jgi:hypothetical protein
LCLFGFDGWSGISRHRQNGACTEPKLVGCNQFCFPMFCLVCSCCTRTARLSSLSSVKYVRGHINDNQQFDLSKKKSITTDLCCHTVTLQDFFRRLVGSPATPPDVAARGSAGVRCQSILNSSRSPEATQCRKLCNCRRYSGACQSRPFPHVLM